LKSFGVKQFGAKQGSSISANSTFGNARTLFSMKSADSSVVERGNGAGSGSASVGTQGTRAVVLASADAAFRQKLNQTLTLQRWRVMEAGGGAEALAHLEGNSVIALLVDTWLPDLEVGEFTAQLSMLYPALDVLRVDALEVSGEKREGVRNPHRGELLYALRQVQDEMSSVGLGSVDGDDAAWNIAPSVVPVAEVGTRDNGNQVTNMIGSGAGILARMMAEENSSATYGINSDVIGKNSGNQVELPSAIAQFGGVGQDPWGENNGNDVHALPIPELVGDSAVMRELVRAVRLVAPRRTSVLLQGPTGSGKEVVAQALHRLSPRRNKPFTVLNCAAIPESLLEAELFGHTRGAFTGAVTSRTGRIEAAHQGTLFLDEIGEMPAALQSKLLRFLENGELQRVGDNENVRVDVRVIAATHQPLDEHIETGRFRADLYHRITVFPIWVPALAERMDDIPLLTNYFLQRMGEEMPIKRLSLAAMQKLYRHHWPGNVRELAHVLERAAILSGSKPEIGEQEIRFNLERRMQA